MRAIFWLKEKPVDVKKELMRISIKTKKSMSQVVCEAILKYGEKIK